MKKVLIGGIGNVLLGDDGVGPYLVRLIASQYEFDEGVEWMDLGTPALELVDNIAGRDAVILVDSIDLDAPAGTVVLFRKCDITAQGSSGHIDAHAPALVDAILASEMFANPPKEVLLVGIVGGSFEPGCKLSEPVQKALPRATAEILIELDQLGVGYRSRLIPGDAGIWWAPAAEFAAVS